MAEEVKRDRGTPSKNCELNGEEVEMQLEAGMAMREAVINRKVVAIRIVLEVGVGCERVRRAGDARCGRDACMRREKATKRLVKLPCM